MTVLSYESNVEWSAVMILVSRVMMSIAELMTCIFADVTSVTVRRRGVIGASLSERPGFEAKRAPPSLYNEEISVCLSARTFNRQKICLGRPG